jgi:ribonuclease T2
MPGTRSDLQRHQWFKHGSCYGTDADTYFRHSLMLLEQLNASGVRSLFEEHIGKRLSATRVRAAFDASFGKGAGDRVRLKCNQGLIEELRIGLKGEVDETADLGKLILAAPPRSPDCRGGRVDVAGADGSAAR